MFNTNKRNCLFQSHQAYIGNDRVFTFVSAPTSENIINPQAQGVNRPIVKQHPPPQKTIKIHHIYR